MPGGPAAERTKFTKTRRGLFPDFLSSPFSDKPFHASLCLGQQGGKVEGVGEHRQPAIGGVRPLVLGTISVKFDAVLIGIVQIKRFAGAVIGRAVERNARVLQSAQGIAQRGSGRVENRDVKEAGCTWRRWLSTRTFPGVEPDVVMVAASGDKRRARTEPLHKGKPEHAAIKRERTFDVGNLQMYVTDPNGRIEGRSRVFNHTSG